MKKIISLLICFIVLGGALFADIKPFYDEYNVSYFKSPSRLIEKNEDIPFKVEVQGRSAVNYLSYLASPSSSLTKASNYLYDTLINSDLAFWDQNYDQIKDIYTSFDSSPFPVKPTNEGDLAQLKAFIKASYEGRYTEQHKAQAVLSALNTTSIFNGINSTPLYSNALLNLSLLGGKAENGFGWQVTGNVGFIGAENMLAQTLNLLDINVRADVGYALNIINEKFAIGISLEVASFMQNYINSYNLLTARFNADPVSAFSNPFKLGLGFALNFSGMYRHNENLAFTLDLRNAINFRTFWDLELTDFVTFNGLDRDRNTYYMPMDLALTAIWDYDKYHISVEFSDIINQIIWDKELPSYSFEFFSIPKFRFAYDINESLSLNTALQYSRLLLGLNWNNLNVELSTSLNKAEFGIKFGYQM